MLYPKMQSYDGEDKALEILDEVEEHSEAFGILAIQDVLDGAGFGGLGGFRERGLR